MSSHEGPKAPPSAVNAGTALTLLLVINLFNYLDRQVLAAVEPEIRRELLVGVDEAEARFRMGLLSTAFLVTYMLLAPVFGWLADRSSRWLLVGIAVILWSVASGASGVNWQAYFGASLATSYWILLATRCFVGVGEGGYGPIAPAMLADLYPVEKRGQVMAYFYLAIPVGGALGYTFGEVMMRQYGWNAAFYAVVPPGIILGIMCFLMRDPPRSRSTAEAASTSGLQKYVEILRIPSYTWNTAGMTAMTFAIGGTAYWMPDFLEFKNVPDLF
ncbi:MAG: MFS transporter, partial [Gemmataceae bacterium]|nr:MFS transporter [Gemmataceae bacterium]